MSGLAAPAPFVILEYDDIGGWLVEDEYTDRNSALIWFRKLVDDGKNVAFIDIQEVQNP